MNSRNIELVLDVSVPVQWPSLQMPIEVVFFGPVFPSQSSPKWVPGNDMGSKRGCRDIDHIVHQVPIGIKLWD